MSTLSIQKPILGSFMILWCNRTAFLKNILPIIIFVSLFILVAVKYKMGNYFSIMAFLVGFLFFSLVAIRFHRLVLLPQGSNEPAFDTKILFKLIRFSLTILALGIIEAIINIPFEPMGKLVPSTLLSNYIAPLLFALPSSYVVARFSLVFPSLAIDQPLSFKESWTLTRSHGLKMVVITVVYPLILMLPLTLLVAKSPQGDIPSIMLIMATVFTFVVITLGIAALSLAYQQLVGKQTKIS